METLFDSRTFGAGKSCQAWKDALCGNYVTVDTDVDAPDDYFGYLKGDMFGEIAMSETHGPSQRVVRKKHHLARVEKDCYYLQVMNRSAIGVRQRDQEFLTNSAILGLYSASEPYHLDCLGVTRARFLEIPRDLLQKEFGDDPLPVTHAISATTGMGKVLAEFCNSIAEASGQLDPDQKAELGQKLLSLTALAARTGAMTEGDERRSIRKARLDTVKAFIEDNFFDPLLSVRRIAAANGISVRYLHRLFEEEETTVAEWLWQRRLERCHEALVATCPGQHITEIAFAHGFNSSSHFSRAFRARYGQTPTEVMNSERSQRS